MSVILPLPLFPLHVRGDETARTQENGRPQLGRDVKKDVGKTAEDDNGKWEGITAGVVN